MRRITAQHHSVKQARVGGRFVKQRTNGKHKIEGAMINTPMTAGMNRIVRPQARYNWLMPNIGAITPQFIEMTLNGAMAGNHVQQWSLFDLMLRTWPELRSCYSELVTSVLRKTIVFEPYCEEDEQPTPDAIERSKLVSTALRKMEPDSENDGNDFEGTIKDILDAWFRGYAVSEVVWNTIDDKQVGTITAPRTSFWVDPCNYGFDANNSIGLLPQRQTQGGAFPPFANTALQLTPPSQKQLLIPFPENKFLVGICKSKAGSPLAGAMLVPLAWWWCAANFSSDWLLNLAQVFGLPFRWANYENNAPQATIDAICTMLQNMGSAGWAAFPVGTTLELHQPSQTGSDHSPQGELLDRADRYCRTLILGQTMTGTHGTTGKGGGQAFGKVEEDVKADRIDAAGKFAMNVINRQLIPSILALNYGDTDEAPSAKFLEDEVADLNEAQRDQILVTAGLPIGVDYMRKKYDIPAPAEGEETLSKPEPASPFGGQGFGGDPENTDETQAPDEENDAAKASDQTGHPFRGNQYVKLGDEVKTPLGNGIVVAQTPEYALVSLHGGGAIRRIKHSDITRIPRDNSSFPSLLQSEENKRRAALNQQLHSKLKQLNAIEDDAVFARELAKLAGEIQAGGDLPGHEFHGNQYTTAAGWTPEHQKTSDKMRGEIEDIRKRKAFIASSIPPGGFNVPESMSAEWDQLSKREFHLMSKLGEHEKPLRVAEGLQRESEVKKWASVRDSEVAQAPVFQHRNSWEIVKNRAEYVLRHPGDKSDVYRGNLKRVREVADESKPI